MSFGATVYKVATEQRSSGVEFPANTLACPIVSRSDSFSFFHDINKDIFSLYVKMLHVYVL